MTKSKSSRRLGNVHMTRPHHMAHMGLWVMLTSTLIILLNITFFQLTDAQHGTHVMVSNVLYDEYVRSRQMFMIALVLEALVAIAALVFLAATTSHRVAGPYIRLLYVFRSVAEGDMAQRLKFRKYDNLGYVENAFNNMMDALNARFGDSISARETSPDNTKPPQRDVGA